MGTVLSVMLTAFAVCSNGDGQILGSEEARIRRDALYQEVSAILEMLAEEEEARRLAAQGDSGVQAALQAVQEATKNARDVADAIEKGRHPLGVEQPTASAPDRQLMGPGGGKTDETPLRPGGPGGNAAQQQARGRPQPSAPPQPLAPP